MEFLGHTAFAPLCLVGISMFTHVMWWKMGLSLALVCRMWVPNRLRPDTGMPGFDKALWDASSHCFVVRLSLIDSNTIHVLKRQDTVSPLMLINLIFSIMHNLWLFYK